MIYITLKYQPDPGVGEFKSYTTLWNFVDDLAREKPNTEIMIEGVRVVRADLEAELKSPGDTVTVMHGEDFWIIIAANYGHFKGRGIL